MPSGEWQRLIEGLRDGDEAVAAEFYAGYRPLLERIADQQLRSDLRRRVGADEVAHSACRTFLRRVDRGEFEISGADRLWALLCAITVQKARSRARYHLAERRAVRRETGASAESDADVMAFLRSSEPTPEETAEFEDQFDHVLTELDETERRVVLLRLDQRTHDEIAAELECSDRTVRRLMKRIESRLFELLGA